MSRKINDMDTLGNRIRQIREGAGLNQLDLARLLGLKSAMAISKYEADQREPNISKLIKLSILGAADLTWLLTGVEPEPPSAVEMEEKDFSPEVLKGLKAHIDNVKGLVAHCNAPDRSSEAPPEQPYGEYVYIPQVTGEISAGGGLIADDTIEMRIGFRREWIERKGDHTKMAIIRVKGDSMQPTLMSGDIVLIDHARNFVDPHGGIYAIAFENEIMVKRVQVLFPANQLRVISDNPKYQPADVDPGTVNINGKVIWFGRELER